MTIRHCFSAFISAALLAGCTASGISEGVYGQHAKIADVSQTEALLKQLPPPKRRPVVSIYDYKDLTGQHKPSDNIAEFSRAVTQGGSHILIKALMEAGNGQWFQVIERTGLDNLLQERKIIRSTRKNYSGDDGQQLADIPPLLYAGLLIEGGIIAYESNMITGGFGARYLGIGGSTEYRRDMVTVYLHATSVSNGEILLSTNASKTIYSTAMQGGVYKYIGLDEILEIESGVSINEPPQYATRQAIEMAVYTMIMEGAEKGLWEFDNQAAGNAILAQYNQFKDGVADLDTVLEEGARATTAVDVATAQPAISPAATPSARPATGTSSPRATPIPRLPNVQTRPTAPVAPQPIRQPTRRLVVPVPTQPAARTNIPHRNIPQPTLEQLPSSARPNAAPAPSRGVPRERTYRSRPTSQRYRNELACDSSGCTPVRPQ